MKQLKYSILFGSLLSSSFAFAGGDTGLYVGAGIGGYSNEIDQSEITSIGATNDFDASGSTGKLIAGFNFGIVPLVEVAAEANYVNFQSIESDSIKVDGNSTNLFGLAGFNMGPIGFFGKAGLANWNLTAKDNGSEKLSGSDPVYGIGARFQLFGITVRGEYEYYDIKDVKLTTTTASLLYTF